MILKLNFFFGLFIGVFVGLAISDIVGFWKFSETVLAFLGGLFGASITVVGAYILTALQESKRQREGDAARYREQLGARALLASDLSRIIDYVKRSAQIAIESCSTINERAPREVGECPQLDTKILIRMQRIIELTGGRNADRIVDLMHCFQVQNSRLQGVLDDLAESRRPSRIIRVMTEENFYFTASGTVELYLRAEAMFSFARLEQEDISPPPFSEERIDSALRKLGFDDWLPDYEIRTIVQTMTQMPPGGRWREVVR